MHRPPRRAQQAAPLRKPVEARKARQPYGTICVCGKAASSSGGRHTGIREADRRTPKKQSRSLSIIPQHFQQFISELKLRPPKNHL